MKPGRFLAKVLFMVMVGGLPAAEKPAGPAPAAAGTNLQVVAYYFHGTIRCGTCLKIEKQARETMEARFPVEMLEKRLVEFTAPRDHLRENELGIRQQEAWGKVLGLLCAVNAAMSRELGVDFARGTAPHLGGCCG